MHLKYHLYKECCNQVGVENDNNSKESTQDKTVVLNRLLADERWIEKVIILFKLHKFVI